MNRRNRGKSQPQRGKKSFKGNVKSSKFTPKRKSKLRLNKADAKENTSTESLGKLQAIATTTTTTTTATAVTTTTTATASVAHKETVNQHVMTARLLEKDVGITEYISKHEGFSGIIKQRFSDFHVNEIDIDGNVVTLTSTSVPELPVDVDEAKKAEDYLKDAVPKDSLEKLKQLLESRGDDTVEIEVSNMSKEDRRKMHMAILKYGLKRLNSNTKERDGKKYITVSAKPDRRVSWPSERGGEYVQFVLHKENMDTMETVNDIAGKLRVKPNLIGYAGTKDRRAKTSQLMSVRRVEPSKLAKSTRNLRGVTLGNFTFKQSGLKLGQLCGNRFRIVLRNVTGKDTQIKEAMTSLEEKGFINYFGLQRFGNSLVIPTYEIGKAILQTKWKEAVELILKPRDGEQMRDLSEARKVWWETRDAARALKLLRNPNKLIEGKLLDALSNLGPNNYCDALNKLPNNALSLYMHAYQSLLWNKVVSRRISEFGLHALAGDLVPKEGSAKAGGDDPAVEEDALNVTGSNEETSFSKKDDVREIGEKELTNIKIEDIVVPLPGYDITYPNNVTGEWMQELLKKDGLESMSFRKTLKHFKVGGTYRRLVIRPTNVKWKVMRYSDPQAALLLSDLEMMQNMPAPRDDPDGAYKALVLEFHLPSSCYATMALREILKTDTSVSLQASLNDYHIPKPVSKSKENGAEGLGESITDTLENGSVSQEGPSKMKTRRNSSQKSESPVKVKGKIISEGDKTEQEDSRVSIDEYASPKKIKSSESATIKADTSVKNKGKRTAEHFDAAVVKPKETLKKPKTVENSSQKLEETPSVKTRAKRSSDHLDHSASETEDAKEEKMEIDDVSSKKVRSENDSAPVKTRGRTTPKHVETTADSEEASSEAEEPLSSKKTRSKSKLRDISEGENIEHEDISKTRSRAKTKVRENTEDVRTEAEENIPIRTRSKGREVSDGSKIHEEAKTEHEDSVPDNPSVRTRSKFREAPVEETKLEGEEVIPCNASLRTRSKAREIPEGGKINDETKLEPEDNTTRENPSVRTRSKVREVSDGNKSAEEVKIESDEGAPENLPVRTRSKVREASEGSKSNDEPKLDSEENTPVRTRSKAMTKSRDSTSESEGSKDDDLLKNKSERSATPSRAESSEDKPSVRTRSRAISKLVESPALESEGGTEDEDTSSVASSPSKAKLPVRTRSKAKCRDSSLSDNDTAKVEPANSAEEGSSSVRTRSRVQSKLRDSPALDTDGSRDSIEGPDTSIGSVRTRSRISSRSRDSPAPDKLAEDSKQDNSEGVEERPSLKTRTRSSSKASETVSPHLGDNGDEKLKVKKDDQKTERNLAMSENIKKERPELERDNKRIKLDESVKKRGKTLQSEKNEVKEEREINQNVEDEKKKLSTDKNNASDKILGSKEMEEGNDNNEPPSLGLQGGTSVSSEDEVKVQDIRKVSGENNEMIEDASLSCVGNTSKGAVEGLSTMEVDSSLGETQKKLEENKKCDELEVISSTENHETDITLITKITEGSHKLEVSEDSKLESAAEKQNLVSDTNLLSNASDGSSALDRSGLANKTELKRDESEVEISVNRNKEKLINVEVHSEKVVEHKFEPQTKDAVRNLGNSNTEIIVPKEVTHMGVTHELNGSVSEKVDSSPINTSSKPDTWKSDVINSYSDLELQKSETCAGNNTENSCNKTNSEVTSPTSDISGSVTESVSQNKDSYGLEKTGEERMHHEDNKDLDVSTKESCLKETENENTSKASASVLDATTEVTGETSHPPKMLDELENTNIHAEEMSVQGGDAPEQKENVNSDEKICCETVGEHNDQNKSAVEKTDHTTKKEQGGSYKNEVGEDRFNIQGGIEQSTVDKSISESLYHMQSSRGQKTDDSAVKQSIAAEAALSSPKTDSLASQDDREVANVTENACSGSLRLESKDISRPIDENTVSESKDTTLAFSGSDLVVKNDEVPSGFINTKCDILPRNIECSVEKDGSKQEKDDGASVLKHEPLSNKNLKCLADREEKTDFLNETDLISPCETDSVCKSEIQEEPLETTDAKVKTDLSMETEIPSAENVENAACFNELVKPQDVDIGDATELVTNTTSKINVYEQKNRVKDESCTKSSTSTETVGSSKAECELIHPKETVDSTISDKNEGCTVDGNELLHKPISSAADKQGDIAKGTILCSSKPVQLPNEDKSDEIVEDKVASIHHDETITKITDTLDRKSDSTFSPRDPPVIDTGIVMEDDVHVRSERNDQNGTSESNQRAEFEESFKIEETLRNDESLNVSINSNHDLGTETDSNKSNIKLTKVETDELKMLPVKESCDDQTPAKDTDISSQPSQSRRDAEESASVVDEAGNIMDVCKEKCPILKSHDAVACGAHTEVSKHKLVAISNANVSESVQELKKLVDTPCSNEKFMTPAVTAVACNNEKIMAGLDVKNTPEIKLAEERQEVCIRVDGSNVSGTKEITPENVSVSAITEESAETEFLKLNKVTSFSATESLVEPISPAEPTASEPEPFERANSNEFPLLHHKEIDPEKLQNVPSSNTLCESMSPQQKMEVDSLIVEQSKRESRGVCSVDLTKEEEKHGIGFNTGNPTGAVEKLLPVEKDSSNKLEVKRATDIQNDQPGDETVLVVTDTVDDRQINLVSEQPSDISKELSGMGQETSLPLAAEISMPLQSAELVDKNGASPIEGKMLHKTEKLSGNTDSKDRVISLDEKSEHAIENEDEMLVSVDLGENVAEPHERLEATGDIKEEISSSVTETPKEISCMSEGVTATSKDLESKVDTEESVLSSKDDHLSTTEKKTVLKSSEVLHSGSETETNTTEQSEEFENEVKGMSLKPPGSEKESKLVSQHVEMTSSATEVPFENESLDKTTTLKTECLTVQSVDLPGEKTLAPSVKLSKSSVNDDILREQNIKEIASTELSENVGKMKTTSSEDSDNQAEVTTPKMRTGFSNEMEVDISSELHEDAVKSISTSDATKMTELLKPVSNLRELSSAICKTKPPTGELEEKQEIEVTGDSQLPLECPKVVEGMDESTSEKLMQGTKMDKAGKLSELTGVNTANSDEGVSECMPKVDEKEDETIRVPRSPVVAYNVDVALPSKTVSENTETLEECCAKGHLSEISDETSGTETTLSSNLLGNKLEEDSTSVGPKPEGVGLLESNENISQKQEGVEQVKEVTAVTESSLPSEQHEIVMEMAKLSEQTDVDQEDVSSEQHRDTVMDCVENGTIERGKFIPTKECEVSRAEELAFSEQNEESVLETKLPEESKFAKKKETVLSEQSGIQSDEAISSEKHEAIQSKDIRVSEQTNICQMDGIKLPEQSRILHTDNLLSEHPESPLTKETKPLGETKEGVPSEQPIITRTEENTHTAMEEIMPVDQSEVTQSKDAIGSEPIVFAEAKETIFSEQSSETQKKVDMPSEQHDISQTLRTKVSEHIEANQVGKNTEQNIALSEEPSKQNEISQLEETESNAKGIPVQMEEILPSDQYEDSELDKDICEPSEITCKEITMAAEQCEVSPVEGVKSLEECEVSSQEKNLSNGKSGVATVENVLIDGNLFSEREVNKLENTMSPKHDTVVLEEEALTSNQCIETDMKGSLPPEQQILPSSKNLKVGKVTESIPFEQNKLPRSDKIEPSKKHEACLMEGTESSEKCKIDPLEKALLSEQPEASHEREIVPSKQFEVNQVDKAPPTGQIEENSMTEAALSEPREVIQKESLYAEECEVTRMKEDLTSGKHKAAVQEKIIIPESCGDRKMLSEQCSDTQSEGNPSSESIQIKFLPAGKLDQQEKPEIDDDASVEQKEKYTSECLEIPREKNVPFCKQGDVSSKRSASSELPVGEEECISSKRLKLSPVEAIEADVSSQEDEISPMEHESYEQHNGDPQKLVKPSVTSQSHMKVEEVCSTEKPVVQVEMSVSSKSNEIAETEKKLSSDHCKVITSEDTSMQPEVCEVGANLLCKQGEVSPGTEVVKSKYPDHKVQSTDNQVDEASCIEKSESFQKEESPEQPDVTLVMKDNEPEVVHGTEGIQSVEQSETSPEVEETKPQKSTGESSEQPASSQIGGKLSESTTVYHSLEESISSEKNEDSQTLEETESPEQTAMLTKQQTSEMPEVLERNQATQFSDEKTENVEALKVKSSSEPSDVCNEMESSSEQHVVLVRMEESSSVEQPNVLERMEESSSVEQPNVLERMEESSSVEQPEVSSRMEESSSVEQPEVSSRMEESSSVEQPEVSSRMEESSSVEQPEVLSRMEESSSVEQPEVSSTMEESSSVEQPEVSSTMEESSSVEQPEVSETMEDSSLEQPEVLERMEESCVGQPEVFERMKESSVKELEVSEGMEKSSLEQAKVMQKVENSEQPDVLQEMESSSEQAKSLQKMEELSSEQAIVLQGMEELCSVQTDVQKEEESSSEQPVVLQGKEESTSEKHEVVKEEESTSFEQSEVLPFVEESESSKQSKVLQRQEELIATKQLEVLTVPEESSSFNQPKILQKIEESVCSEQPEVLQREELSISSNQLEVLQRVQESASSDPPDAMMKTEESSASETPDVLESLNESSFSNQAQVLQNMEESRSNQTGILLRLEESSCSDKPEVLQRVEKSSCSDQPEVLQRMEESSSSGQTEVLQSVEEWSPLKQPDVLGLVEKSSLDQSDVLGRVEVSSSDLPEVLQEVEDPPSMDQTEVLQKVEDSSCSGHPEVLQRMEESSCSDQPEVLQRMEESSCSDQPEVLQRMEESSSSDQPEVEQRMDESLSLDQPEVVQRVEESSSLDKPEVLQGVEESSSLDKPEVLQRVKESSTDRLVLQKVEESPFLGQPGGLRKVEGLSCSDQLEVLQRMEESCCDQPKILQRMEDSLSLDQPEILEKVEESSSSDQPKVLQRVRESSSVDQPEVLQRVGESSPLDHLKVLQRVEDLSSSDQPEVLRKVEDSSCSGQQEVLERMEDSSCDQPEVLQRLEESSCSDQPKVLQKMEESSSSLQSEILEKVEELSSSDQPEVLQRVEESSSSDQPEVLQNEESSSLDQPEVLQRVEESSSDQPEVLQRMEESSASDQPEVMQRMEESPSSDQPEILQRVVESSSLDQPEVLQRVEESSSDQPEVVQRMEESSPSDEPEVVQRIEESSPSDEPEVMQRMEESSSLDQPEVLQRVEDSSSLDQPEVLQRVEESSDQPEVMQRMEESSPSDQPEVVQRMEESSYSDQLEVLQKVEESSPADQPEVLQRAEEASPADQPEVLQRAEEASPANQPEVLQRAEEASPADQPEVLQRAEEASPADQPEVLQRAEEASPSDQPEVLQRAEEASPSDQPEMLQRAEEASPSDQPEVLQRAEEASPSDQPEVLQRAEEASPSDQPEVLQRAEEASPSDQPEVLQRAEEASPSDQPEVLQRAEEASPSDQPEVLQRVEEASPLEQPEVLQKMEESPTLEETEVLQQLKDTTPSKLPEIVQRMEESSAPEQHKVMQGIEKSPSELPEVMHGVEDSSSKQPEILQRMEESSSDHPEVLNRMEESSSLEQPKVLQRLEESLSSEQPEVLQRTKESSSPGHFEVSQRMEESSTSEQPEVLERKEESSSFEQPMILERTEASSPLEQSEAMGLVENSSTSGQPKVLQRVEESLSSKQPTILQRKKETLPSEQLEILQRKKEMPSTEQPEVLQKGEVSQKIQGSSSLIQPEASFVTSSEQGEVSVVESSEKPETLDEGSSEQIKILERMESSSELPDVSKKMEKISSTAKSEVLQRDGTSLSSNHGKMSRPLPTLEHPKVNGPEELRSSDKSDVCIALVEPVSSSKQSGDVLGFKDEQKSVTLETFSTSHAVLSEKGKESVDSSLGKPECSSLVEDPEPVFGCNITSVPTIPSEQSEDTVGKSEHPKTDDDIEKTIALPEKSEDCITEIELQVSKEDTCVHRALSERNGTIFSGISIINNEASQSNEMSQKGEISNENENIKLCELSETMEKVEFVTPSESSATDGETKLSKSCCTPESGESEVINLIENVILPEKLEGVEKIKDRALSEPEVSEVELKTLFRKEQCDVKVAAQSEQLDNSDKKAEGGLSNKLVTTVILEKPSQTLDQMVLSERLGDISPVLEIEESGKLEASERNDTQILDGIEVGKVAEIPLSDEKKEDEVLCKSLEICVGEEKQLTSNAKENFHSSILGKGTETLSSPKLNSDFGSVNESCTAEQSSVLSPKAVEANDNVSATSQEENFAVSNSHANSVQGVCDNLEDAEQSSVNKTRQCSIKDLSNEIFCKQEENLKCNESDSPSTGTILDASQPSSRTVESKELVTSETDPLKSSLSGDVETKEFDKISGNSGDTKLELAVKRKADEDDVSSQDDCQITTKKVRLPAEDNEQQSQDVPAKRKADDADNTNSEENKRVRLGESTVNGGDNEEGSEECVLKRKSLEVNCDGTEAKKAKLEASDAPE